MGARADFVLRLEGRARGVLDHGAAVAALVVPGMKIEIVAYAMLSH